jgi:hypothetical protein
MIEVNRLITFYDKNGDTFRGEILLDKIELQSLLEIITIEKYKDDNLLYDCYLLNKEMLDRLSKQAEKKIDYNLNEFEYYLEAISK